MKTSYVFLAPGFEEIEALGTVDALRRGGITVKTVSITDENTVVGAHGIPVVADIKFDEIDDNPDWLILPGGMPGATNLFNCEPLTNLLIEHHKAGGHIAAICASPGVVLGQLGLLNGETATCYPGFDDLCAGATMKDVRSVVSGQFVTANGPSSTLNLVYEILKINRDKQTADEVMQGMLLFPKQQTYYF